MSDDFKNNYFQIFRGSCFGIGLSKRGENDPHILFTILHEDDEHWWDSQEHPVTFSSFWHEDLPNTIKQATKWCEENAISDVVESIQYGWKLKQ